MKAFIGLDNIASFIADWSEGFKQNGIRVMTAVHNMNSKLKKSKVHYRVGRDRKIANWAYAFRFPRISFQKKKKWYEYWWNRILNKALKECEYFLFLWQTFECDTSDLKGIKERKKKIIVFFCGDDARWYYAMEQEFKKFGLKPISYEGSYDYSAAALENRLSYIRNTEKYADLIITNRTAAQLLLRPYFPIHIPIKQELLSHYKPQRKEKVRVAHAPSSRKFKGSDDVITAIESLKQELDFDFVLVENVPHNEALKIYMDCDIVVDQLLCPAGGKLAFECLALGKVVLSQMSYGAYTDWYHNCPIIDTNSNSLRTDLRDIILDTKKRQRLSEAGPTYIKQHHDPAKIIKDIVAHLNGTFPLSLYKPSFFREEFMPESADRIDIYNKWTEYVSDCDWYEKEVLPGERANLKF